MGYKIAVCDDEVGTCKDLEDKILTIFSDMGTEVCVKCTQSGEELVEYLKAGEKYDFILLDIQLVNLNGIDIGVYIRNELSDHNTQIIFISSMTQYVMQLFQIQPLDFLLKPVDIESLRKAIDTGINILHRSHECFSFAASHRKIRIPFDSIQYFESEGRQIKIVNSDDPEYFYDKLSDLEDDLPGFFARIHRSYIINLNNIRTCRYDEVVMNNGDTITVGRSYRDGFRELLMKREWG